MSLTVDKKLFVDLQQKAFPIVPTKSSLQILSNFRLTSIDDSFELTATDLDHSIRLRCPVSGDRNLDVTVNARKVFEISRELHEGVLEINVDENVLLLNSGGSFSCKIAGADTQDFPAFPILGETHEFDLPISILKDLVQKSSFAVSKDETRACLCGVLWEIENTRMGMIATDGHRLGSTFYEGEFDVVEKISCIVSPKSLNHLIKILPGDDLEEKVHVAIGEKYIQFTYDTMTLCSKLIDGPYPDYEKVIPKSNPKKAIIENSVLQEAVRRVSVLSSQKTHLVKFTFEDNQLEIVVLNRDIGGEARQIIPVEYEGEKHSIGFNASYLSEILSIAKSARVRIEMNTQISACLVFPIHEEEEMRRGDELFLIMPLRIMDEMQ